MVGQMFNLAIVLFLPCLEGKTVHWHLTDGFLSVETPLNLCDSCNDLAWLLQNPVFTCIV